MQRWWNLSLTFDFSYGQSSDYTKINHVGTNSGRYLAGASIIGLINMLYKHVTIIYPHLTFPCLRSETAASGVPHFAPF